MDSCDTEILADGEKGVSLVIPAFNEAEGIAEMIRQADEALAPVLKNYEIIVVDDGSRDATYARACAAASELSSVRVVRHELNRGYGAAIRTGLDAARHELVAFTDADQQFDLTDLPRLLLRAQDYDLVCGYRIDRQDPWIRKVYSRVYNVLVRALLGTGIRDVDCALKVFHRRHLPQLALTAEGFLINAELLTQARRHDLSVVEVGVTHRSRQSGQSTVSSGHILPVLAALLRFWWNRVMFPGPAEAAPLPPSQSSLIWKRLLPLLLVVTAALTLFANLEYPLIDRDETRYAEIPREMLVVNDWISPRLNFEPYYDKPPLLYWLCAASYTVFGVSEWSARLAPAAAAWALICSTMWFGGRMFGRRVGVLSGGVLLATVGFMFCGRFLLIDMWFSLLVSLALFASFEAIRGREVRWRWWLAAAACCGLGVLAKGPASVVLWGPPLVAFAFLSEKLAAVRLRHWIAFGGIVGCVAGPWFVTAAVKDPQFLQEFIYTHNIRRFAGAFHVQPFWYFVPVGLVGGHPWTMLLVPYGLFLLSRNREVGVMRPPAMGFLLLWGGWCFLFFSASQCKLPTYILPIAPAFALLVAHYLDCALWRVPRMRSFGGGQLLAPRLSAVTSCVAALGAGAAAYKLQLATGGFVVVSTLVWTVLLALVTAVCFRRRDARVAWLVGFSVAMLLMWQVTQVWVPEFGRSQMVMSPRDDDAPWLRDDEQVVATFAHEWSAIPFYSRRNDIRNFKESGRLAEFVANHARTLIVSTTRQDLRRLRQLLPKSTQLTLLQQVPYGQIILAENDVGVQASAAARSDLDRR